MKSQAEKIIITGGVLNSLFALFHLYLGYMIVKSFGGSNAYPLMQMLNVGGVLMIFFLAYTSLAFPAELISSKLGRAIVLLNLLVYNTRIFGEIILSPNPKPVIMLLCLVMVVVYILALIKGKKSLS